MNAMELAFEEELKKLPLGAQQNIREAMERDESLSFNMFKAGWKARSNGLDQHSLLNVFETSLHDETNNNKPDFWCLGKAIAAVVDKDNEGNIDET